MFCTAVGACRAPFYTAAAMAAAMAAATAEVVAVVEGESAPAGGLLQPRPECLRRSHAPNRVHCMLAEASAAAEVLPGITKLRFDGFPDRTLGVMLFRDVTNSAEVRTTHCLCLKLHRKVECPAASCGACAGQRRPSCIVWLGHLLSVRA